MQRAYRELITAGLSVAALCWTPTSTAVDDLDDPDNGESRILMWSPRTVRDTLVVAGTLRATDDFGVVRDRSFRVESSGDAGHGTRSVVLYRHEPECPQLAAIAHMTPDAFCDRLTMSYNGPRVAIAFRSFDANHRYRFTLAERAPGYWESVSAPDLVAPTLALTMRSLGQTTSYEWSLDTTSTRYNQSGALDDEQLRAARLSPLEGSLITLGDVLRSFNSHAFAYSDLPREHPEHEPTPYGDWDEELIEDGCIFIVCFGSLGDGSGLGGNDPPSHCDPSNADYDPGRCPWDLTYSTWPISQRVKIWKVDNNEVRYLFHLRNGGIGTFDGAQPLFGPDASFAFVSLVPLDGGSPVVSPDDPPGTACSTHHGVYSFAALDVNAVVPQHLILAPGTAVPTLKTRLPCPASPNRPDGRYRLYLHIDPSDVFDHPQMTYNNIGNSGLLDWVNLR